MRTQRDTQSLMHYGIVHQLAMTCVWNKFGGNGWT